MRRWFYYTLTLATVLSASVLSNVALADSTDPLLGDWNVTYGSAAVVTISGTGGDYTVTAKTPVQVSGASCFLPVGTTIATFSGTGPVYSGQHGLWYTSDCSFGYFDPTTFTLSGNTLTAVLDNGYGTVIFNKSSAAAPHMSAQGVNLFRGFTLNNALIGTFTDQHPADIGSYTVSVDWGDNSTGTAQVACAPGATVFPQPGPNPGSPAPITACTQYGITGSHYYPGDAGSYDIRFTITAADGTTALASTNAQIGYYLAMGDSYSSGEGIGTYDQGTDTLTNTCHRSTLKAWGGVLARTLGYDASDFSLVACSGARSTDLLGTSHDPFKESENAQQMASLGKYTGLVTLTIGGNDAQFSDVLTSCILTGSGDFNSTAVFLVHGIVATDNQCINKNRQRFSSDLTTLETNLSTLLSAIELKAPNARIVLLTYPRLLDPNHTCNQYFVDGVPNSREYFDSTKIRFLDGLGSSLDSTVRSVGINSSPRVTVVDGSNAVAGHEACNGPLTNQWINDLQIHGTSQPESFHPNASGFQAMSRVVETSLLK